MSALVVLLGIGHVASAAPIPLVLEEPEVIKPVITTPAVYQPQTNATLAANTSSTNKAYNDAYNAGYNAGYNKGYDNASSKNTTVVTPSQTTTATYPNQYNSTYPNQYNNAYPGQMSGGIYPNSNNGNDLAALSLAGSGGFMPSSIWQWLLVILLILIVIIIVRMLGRKPEHHEVHTVTSH